MNGPTMLNNGAIIDPSIPMDRYIVGAYIVLKDESGKHSIYALNRNPEGADETHPSPDVQQDIASMIVTAHQLSNMD